MWKTSIKPVLFSFSFMLLFLSCASLPKATVDLSLLLDKQLSALEQNHILLIDKYFEEKQYHTLSFLDNVWYPDYLENFFNDKEAEEIWEEIIHNPDKKERISDLQMIVSIVQAKYMEMRDSLLLPLETARREVHTAVQQEYNMAKTMNNAILNNISSVNEIQEARKEYMSKIVDVNSIEKKMNVYLEKADQTLNQIQRAMESYNKAESKLESIIENLK